MATGLRAKPKPTKKGTAAMDAGRTLYLYAISRKSQSAPPRIVAEGIDGEAPVEAVSCEGYTCWVSRVDREEFVDELTRNMENLDWLASAGLRHQRVVSAISEKLAALPARFGTVFLGEASMTQHIRERKRTLDEAFQRIADADEWGIKVFRVANATATPAQRDHPASGIEYLKGKAERRKSAVGGKLDNEILALAERLSSLAVASSPGGKASAGQPGLLWHGSFLILRKDREKLEALLNEFARTWHNTRRIDWSGPWPPYSFVNNDAD
jgi:hypothetical protein